jgi:phosphate transport system substrate-binding protein
MNEFIDTYAAQDALGAGGYLEERGLVVLSDDKIIALQDALTNSVNMTAPAK